MQDYIDQINVVKIPYTDHQNIFPTEFMEILQMKHGQAIQSYIANKLSAFAFSEKANPCMNVLQVLYGAS